VPATASSPARRTVRRPCASARARDDDSPDGRWVLTIPLFGSPAHRRRAHGAGAPRTLGLGFARHAWAGWFPDSRRVVFTAAPAGQPMRAYVQGPRGRANAPADGRDRHGAVVRDPGFAAPARAHARSGRAVAVPTAHGRRSPTGPPQDVRPAPSPSRPTPARSSSRPGRRRAPPLVERVDVVTASGRPGPRSAWRTRRAPGPCCRSRSRRTASPTPSACIESSPSCTSSAPALTSALALAVECC
jgi:hypothetical protein